MDIIEEYQYNAMVDTPLAGKYDGPGFHRSYESSR